MRHTAYVLSFSPMLSTVVMDFMELGDMSASYRAVHGTPRLRRLSLPVRRTQLYGMYSDAYNWPCFTERLMELQDMGCRRQTETEVRNSCQIERTGRTDASDYLFILAGWKYDWRWLVFSHLFVFLHDLTLTFKHVWTALCTCGKPTQTSSGRI